MIELELLQRIWTLIDIPAEDDLGLNAQELESIQLHTEHPLLALDAKQRRHLLLPTRQDMPMEEDKRSAGVHIIESRWGNEGTRYVDIVCLKPHLNELFDMVVVDILDQIALAPAFPDQVAGRVLARWRELISRQMLQHVDLSTIIGLFGELQILRQLTQRTSRAIETWGGPSGAKHDFWIPGRLAIEVKTTTSESGDMFVVHSLDQLADPSDASKLYLAFLKVKQVESDGETLLELINDLVRFGCSRPHLLGQVATLGVTEDVLLTIEDVRFELVEQRLYAVDEQFPRLTRHSLVSGHIPNGVFNVQYQVDLSSGATPLNTTQAQRVIELYASALKFI